MALDRLSEAGIVELDEERKAAMVSNLLVVLCGDRRASRSSTPGRSTRATASPEAAGCRHRVRRRRERKAVLLRLDPEVHEALARWAADDLRSINAQIEWLLRRAVTDAGRLRRDETP